MWVKKIMQFVKSYFTWLQRKKTKDIRTESRSKNGGPQTESFDKNMARPFQKPDYRSAVFYDLTRTSVVGPLNYFSSLLIILKAFLDHK